LRSTKQTTAIGTVPPFTEDAVRRAGEDFTAVEQMAPPPPPRFTGMRQGHRDGLLLRGTPDRTA
jgi:hypothetical protein